jgi:hypothetical protein
MALTSATYGSRAVVTPPVLTAPTSTTETVSAPGRGVYCQVVVGATTTTITAVRPGTNEEGDAVADYSTGAIVSTERWIPISGEFRDPTTGLATLTFSQLTNVTARLHRFPG